MFFIQMDNIQTEPVIYLLFVKVIIWKQPFEFLNITQI